MLRAIVARRGSIIAPVSSGWQRERELICDTRSRTELLLSDPAALQLTVSARAAARFQAPLLRPVSSKAGSARLICAEKGDAELHLFDVFETLQNSNGTDGDDVRAHFGQTYGAQDEVRKLLHGYPNLHFHVGLSRKQPAASRSPLQFRAHRSRFAGSDLSGAGSFFIRGWSPAEILLADDYCDPDVKACLDLGYLVAATRLSSCHGRN